MVDTIKYNDTINLYSTLDPNITDVFDDNATYCTSNNSMLEKKSTAFAANQGKMSFADIHTIADTGATLVFAMKGIPMQNVK
jgi:hypothetical protein